MLKEEESTLDEDFEEPRSRARLLMYWITSTIATLIILLFTFFLMMVPGVLSSTKVWMLSIAAIAVIIPLLIGFWRFSSTEAPFMEQPLGPIVGVILILELVHCILGISFLLFKTN